MSNKKATIYFIKKQINILFIIAIICVGIIPAISLAQKVGIANPALNPAAEYCKNLGYEYFVKSTPKGDYGYCRMPDGKEIEAWKFLQGEEGLKYGYCEKKGYSPKVVSGKQCHYSKKCVVCVLDDKSEVEVTQLIKQEKEGKKNEIVQPVSKQNHLIIFFALIATIFVMIIIAYFVIRDKNNNGQSNNFK